MIAWWNQLTGRERQMVNIGVVLVAFLLLYALAWQPFTTELERLRQGVATQRADLAWMQQAALTVKRLENHPNLASSQTLLNGRPSLLTVVDQTAREAGLDKTVKRVEPQSDGKVRIRLEQVGFDPLIAWLGTLERDYDIQTAHAVIERRAAAGLVDTRLVLQGTKF